MSSFGPPRADGYTHLYMYDYDGHLIRQLTAGAWVVDDFRKRAVMGIDEKTRTVYFSATGKARTERHLYSSSLDTADPHRVQRDHAGAGACTVFRCRLMRVSMSS